MATMFPCPHCGGQLRYHPGVNLVCQSCGSSIDAGSYKPDDKVMGDKINTKIFTCSACAGEIQLIDNDGMEFCPYCGSQATMQERFSEEGAPKYILPFSRTKDDIKKRYEEVTSEIPFAPDGLKDDKNIEKMVGLYVPYYLYDYSVHGRVDYDGVREVESSTERFTYFAHVNMYFNTDDLKIPFDASETLDDTIAEKLEPFPLDDLEKFNPNYLAGFFVENTSVDKNLYTEESLDNAVDYAFDRGKGGIVYKTSQAKEQIAKNSLRQKVRLKDVEGAYLPMYFSTAKYGDREAYSIANGVTGNTYIDMPIDKRKMFYSALFTSLVIFVLLLAASTMFSFSYKIKNICSFAALVSSIIALTGAKLARETYDSDNHIYDKGFNPNAKRRVKPNKKKKTNSLPKIDVSGTMIVIILVSAPSFIAMIFAGAAGFATSSIGSFFIQALIYIASAIICIKAIATSRGDRRALILGVLGYILSVTIRLIDMPNDLYYYGAMVGVFAVILLSINAMVSEYNRFATHPSPQFMKKGGGLENAKNN